MVAADVGAAAAAADADRIFGNYSNFSRYNNALVVVAGFERATRHNACTKECVDKRSARTPGPISSRRHRPTRHTRILELTMLRRLGARNISKGTNK